MSTLHLIINTLKCWYNDRMDFMVQLMHEEE
jgi:hypothetical protein